MAQLVNYRILSTHSRTTCTSLNLYWNYHYVANDDWCWFSGCWLNRAVHIIHRHIFSRQGHMLSTRPPPTVHPHRVHSCLLVPVCQSWAHYRGQVTVICMVLCHCCGLMQAPSQICLCVPVAHYKERQSFHSLTSLHLRLSPLILCIRCMWNHFMLYIVWKPI